MEQHALTRSPGSSPRLAGVDIHADHAVLPGHAFLGGLPKTIETLLDRDVVETKLRKKDEKLCLRQSAGDSTGPQIDIAANRLRQLGGADDVAVQELATRPENPEDLTERLILVRREIQHAVDAGALVIVVPTVDTVEEAIEARNWTYFPPLGRRSNGGGQAFDAAMWGGVPGGYRNTINDNMVLILMIETLEGVKNADAIAKVPGVTALFAASGDLGNFSGYRQGTPDYERAINIVHDSTLRAGIRLCGPIAWRDRPDFTCFQAGSETAAIARGVAAELGPLGNTQAKPEVGPFAGR